MTLYKLPKLIDINAKSKVIRGSRRLLIVSRCLELEHPEVIERFRGDYSIVTVCPEEEHINHVGFKLAGMIARSDFDEVSVLSVDGSLHCIQLHFMVEEIFKFMDLDSKVRRKHYVVEKGRVMEVDSKAVKTARYLSKVQKLLQG